MPTTSKSSPSKSCRPRASSNGSHNDDWENGPCKAPRRATHAPLTEKVTRSTRISYECGVSLLLDDILEDFDDCLDLGDEDPIDTILKLTSQ